MSIYLLFLVLGLGSGVTYAILALGLVLKYRAAGVVDFAHGAVAMFVAYVFLNLRQNGLLEFPWIVLPHDVAVGPSTGVSTAVALVVSLGYAAVLGLVLYMAVYRPLRNAAPLTKVCASVGIMLTLEAIAVLNFGSQAKSVVPILPSSPVTFAGVTFPEDRLWFTGIMVAIALVMGVVYKRTRFGLATTAGAENERGAALSGISPTRIAAQNWVLASVLAGLGGILIAPISNLDPTSYTLFVVPALGCALVGRFTSFWWTAGAGLLIGIGQSEITKLLTVFAWLPQQGLPDALPFIVIIAATAIGSRSVLGRSASAEAHNPSVGRPRAPYLTAGACLALGIVILVVLQGSLRNGFIASLSISCIALSLVVLTGYVGQVSLAQMSFAGIGGFMVGHLATSYGIGFPFSLLLAGLAAVPLGLLIGLPALRLRGISLAVVTLGAAAAADALLFNIASFSGGVAGLPVPPPRLFGWNLGIAEGNSYPRVIFGVVVLVVVILMGLLVARLRLSRAGRMLLAIRSNERAAASIGINVAEAKLAAFGLAAFIAGIGGALIGYQQGTLTPDGFSAFTSLGLLAIVYVAGIGRISGAVFAGVMISASGLAVTFLSNELNIGQYQTLVAGVLLAATALANPDGVMSTELGKGPAVLFLKGLTKLGAVMPGARAGVSQAGEAAGNVGQPVESSAVTASDDSWTRERRTSAPVAPPGAVQASEPVV